MNEKGVELMLGDELVTQEGGKEIHAVRLASVTGTGSFDGTLAVFDDQDGADTDLKECRGTVDLLCFRASNVVVVLEGGGLAAQRLGVAMQRVSED